MGFLQRILGLGQVKKTRSEIIYRQIMSQSRRPEFYGEGRIPDNYDGRLDLLTMHMAVYMGVVRKAELAAGVDTGKNNEGSFSQRVFDVMVKDFDVALREEGYTDTGVKKRIKPMIGFFYKRLKTLSESLENGDNLSTAIAAGPATDTAPEFVDKLAQYLKASNEKFAEQSLSQLVDEDLKFPNF